MGEELARLKAVAGRLQAMVGTGKVGGALKTREALGADIAVLADEFEPGENDGADEPDKPAELNKPAELDAPVLEAVLPTEG
jgi:hypothetical protein